jgi:hypothetical protein
MTAKRSAAAVRFDKAADSYYFTKDAVIDYHPSPSIIDSRVSENVWPVKTELIKAIHGRVGQLSFCTTCVLPIVVVGMHGVVQPLLRHFQ